MSAVTNEILRAGRFTPATSYQKFAYACAALLLASGVFHGFVFLFDGGAWEGPVSWRKPIVFGLTFRIRISPAIQLTVSSMMPNESPKTIGLRQDTGPSHAPPSKRNTNPWNTPLASSSAAQA